eukprot:SAG11_NODE_101_length_16738_cov_8.254703_6_plen_226_part_00
MHARSLVDTPRHKYTRDLFPDLAILPGSHQASADFSKDIVKAVATLVGCSMAELDNRSMVEVQRAAQYIGAMTARGLGAVVGRGAPRAIRDLFEVWVEVDPGMHHRGSYYAKSGTPSAATLFRTTIVPIFETWLRATWKYWVAGGDNPGSLANYLQPAKLRVTEDHYVIYVQNAVRVRTGCVAPVAPPSNKGKGAGQDISLKGGGGGAKTQCAHCGKGFHSESEC